MTHSAFHEVIIKSMTIKPEKFLMFFNANHKPNEAELQVMVTQVRDLIRARKLIEINLDDIPQYALVLGDDPRLLVLLCMAYADFFLETTSRVNRSKLPVELVGRRQCMADNITTYLTAYLRPFIDYTAMFEYILDKQSPPSVRPIRRPSTPQMKSVQAARPTSSNPPAS